MRGTIGRLCACRWWRSDDTIEHIGATIMRASLLSLVTICTSAGDAVGQPSDAATPWRGRAPAFRALPTLAEQDSASRDRYGDPLPPGAVARLGTVRLTDSGQVLGLAFAPDTQLLFSAHSSGVVSTWDPKTGKRVAETEIRDGCRAMALSSDGK